MFSNEYCLAAIATQMSSAVLPGFLQLVELETDPQCLLICFNMFCHVVKAIPLGVYSDDMFEYPAGYFPIDFNGVRSAAVFCFTSTQSLSAFVYWIAIFVYLSVTRHRQQEDIFLWIRIEDRFLPFICSHQIVTEEWLGDNFRKRWMNVYWLTQPLLIMSLSSA